MVIPSIATLRNLNLGEEAVEVWGYSLPQSDTAVRSVLNCLRFRLAQCNITVRVHDPLRDGRDSWQEFLGGAAETDKALLG